MRRAARFPAATVVSERRHANDEHRRIRRALTQHKQPIHLHAFPLLRVKSLDNRDSVGYRLDHETECGNLRTLLGRVQRNQSGVRFSALESRFRSYFLAEGDMPLTCQHHEVRSYLAWPQAWL